MFARLMTWWTFFRISMEERLVYRGDFALGTLMRFLPIVTQIFLWHAIFEAVADSDSGDELANDHANRGVAVGEANPGAVDLDGADPDAGDVSEPDDVSVSDDNADPGDRPPVAEKRIENYTFPDIVAYYLLAMISRAFSSMPGLTPGIARQIQTGEIKKFMIQPVDLLGCLLIQRIAHKLVYYLIAVAPFAFVFYLCRGYFVNGWPDMNVMLAFVASLIMAFLLGYFIEACMGLIGFWFLEVTSLTFVYMLLNFFLSGHMFPLDLLPTDPINVQAIVDYLPFKYLAYFPAAIFLGKIETDQLTISLAVELAWLVFFITLSRLLWWRGVKRYSGFGG